MDTLGIDLLPALERLYGGVPEGSRLVKLAGDASTRSYYRLTATGAARGPEKLIVMHLPPDALGSDEGTSGEHPHELPFLDVQRLLHERGVPVPEVLAADVDRRVVLLEDLGDETFEARLRSSPRSRWGASYDAAVDLLADLHARCEAPHPGSIAYRRTFDEALLRWELDHFREWGLEALHGPLAPDDRAALDRHFDRLAATLAAAPAGFVHRDYQSRNLMWAPRQQAPLVVIDFQDAMRGPRAYDLVALSCDSYVDLDAALQRRMIGRYVGRRGLEGADAEAFEQEAFLVTVQRKLKDAGRFVFIDRMRNNPAFLRWYAPSLVYVGRALEALGGLDGLGELLTRLVPGFPNQAETPAATSGADPREKNRGPE